MQFPQAEAARLSFDAPFPCTTPAPTRAFVLIRDREGGFEREFFGVEVRMLSWRKCAGNPIIYPERNRSLGSSILIRDSKDFLHPAENNRRGDKEGTTWIDRIETKRSPLNFSHLWEMAIFLRSLYDEYCWIIIKLRDEVSCVAISEARRKKSGSIAKRVWRTRNLKLARMREKFSIEIKIKRYQMLLQVNSKFQNHGNCTAFWRI